MYNSAIIDLLLFDDNDNYEHKVRFYLSNVLMRVLLHWHFGQLDLVRNSEMMSTSDRGRGHGRVTHKEKERTPSHSSASTCIHQ